MSFLYPLWLVLIGALVPLFWFEEHRRQAVGFSQLSVQKTLDTHSLIARLPMIALWLFWIGLCLAMSRPQLEQAIEKPVIQTRDFVIVTDISDSMNWGIVDQSEKSLSAAPGNNKANAKSPSVSPVPPILLSGRPNTKVTRRIEVAEKSTAAFIERRKADRIGLILFDHKAYYSWPLTTDLKVITLKNSGLSRYIGQGTNFDGPSAANPLLGPLQAAVDHFKEMSTARAKVLILVTDGEEKIAPERSKELSSQIKQAGIKMYVLGIGADWSSNTLTEDLRRFTDDVGGLVIPVSNSQEMSAGFDQIDRLETSGVQIETVVNNVEIYHWFLLSATLCGLTYLFISALTAEDA